DRGTRDVPAFHPSSCRGRHAAVPGCCQPTLLGAGRPGAPGPGAPAPRSNHVGCRPGRRDAGRPHGRRGGARAARHHGPLRLPPAPRAGGEAPEPLVRPAPSAAPPAPALGGLTPPAQGPPAAATPPAPRWFIMRELQGTGLGALLDDDRVSVSGWTDVSYTAS